jgi:hypothetical protein
MLLEALDTEQLGADGIFEDRGGAQDTRPHMVAPRVMSSEKHVTGVLTPGASAMKAEVPATKV